METHVDLSVSDPQVSITRTRSSESALETFKNSVAGKMESAANSIRERARRIDDRNGSLSSYAERASRWLDTSSDYLQRHDINEIKNDAQAQIRRNPGRSLLIAGAVGLVVGALLRRR